MKLIEDISRESLLQFTEYCPQLLSLNTWDFDYDAQVVLVLKKIRMEDDSDAEYTCREVSVDDVGKMLQHCPHPKSTRQYDVPFEIHWTITFIQIMDLCAQVDEINYKEPELFLMSISMCLLFPAFFRGWTRMKQCLRLC